MVKPVQKSYFALSFIFTFWAESFPVFPGQFLSTAIHNSWATHVLQRPRLLCRDPTREALVPWGEYVTVTICLSHSWTQPQRLETPLYQVSRQGILETRVWCTPTGTGSFTVGFLMDSVLLYVWKIKETILYKLTKHIQHTLSELGEELK